MYITLTIYEIAGSYSLLVKKKGWLWSVRVSLLNQFEPIEAKN